MSYLIDIQTDTQTDTAFKINLDIYITNFYKKQYATLQNKNKPLLLQHIYHFILHTHILYHATHIHLKKSLEALEGEEVTYTLLSTSTGQ